MFTYVAFPAIETEADFIRDFYDKQRTSPENCLYTVIDKVLASGEPNHYAGVLALYATNPVNAVTEMGAIIFRAFHPRGFECHWALASIHA